jgi:hypothetical protein
MFENKLLKQIFGHKELSRLELEDILRPKREFRANIEIVTFRALKLERLFYLLMYVW